MVGDAGFQRVLSVADVELYATFAQDFVDNHCCIVFPFIDTIAVDFLDLPADAYFGGSDGIKIPSVTL